MLPKLYVSIVFYIYSFKAETFNPSTNPIVAVKGCRLSDYNGKGKLRVPVKFDV